MIPTPATKKATAERTLGKGNHHQRLQRKKPSHLPRASVVLSVADPSRCFGGRGPQSGGMSRCRQRLLGPTSSSIVGCHLLARCTLQPQAMASEILPLAAHLHWHCCCQDVIADSCNTKSACYIQPNSVTETCLPTGQTIAGRHGGCKDMSSSDCW